jgi:hypothetical protein
MIRGVVVFLGAPFARLRNRRHDSLPPDQFAWVHLEGVG